MVTFPHKEQNMPSSSSLCLQSVSLEESVIAIVELFTTLKDDDVDDVDDGMITHELWSKSVFDDDMESIREVPNAFRN